MRRWFTWTADDEEPDCNECDHVCDDDKYCVSMCGSEHGWNRYERTDFIEIDDE